MTKASFLVMSFFLPRSSPGRQLSLTRTHGCELLLQHGDGRWGRNHAQVPAAGFEAGIPATVIFAKCKNELRERASSPLKQVCTLLGPQRIRTQRIPRRRVVSVDNDACGSLEALPCQKGWTWKPTVTVFPQRRRGTRAGASRVSALHRMHGGGRRPQRQIKHRGAIDGDFDRHRAESASHKTVGQSTSLVHQAPHAFIHLVAQHAQPGIQNIGRKILRFVLVRIHRIPGILCGPPRTQHRAPLSAVQIQIRAAGTADVVGDRELCLG